MTASAGVRVGACVDCATTIIGERLRCPGCHGRHAEELMAATVCVVDGDDLDDAVTAPRPRSAADPGLVVSWIAVVVVLAITVSVMLLLAAVEF